MTTPHRDLHFGDCLNVLQDSVADASVDLVYLDPPFNSNQDYNLLFKAPGGEHTQAQITAFKDTWHWDTHAAREYQALFRQKNTDLSQLLDALRRFLGENDLLAYLVMLAGRLLQLHRVLKPTGSLYLHCDPTASHYIKILLDAVFGKENYRNEITWRRTSAHSDRRGRQYGRNVDLLFFYTCSDTWTWNKQCTPYDAEYIAKYFNKKDTRGRYSKDNLAGPGTPKGGDSGQPWRGVDPAAIGRGRGWGPPREAPPGMDPGAYARMTSRQRLDALDAAGRIAWPQRKGGIPRLKRYLDEQPGIPLQVLWTDIASLGVFGAARKESLGYPTQKPLALLERIIQVSSNPGDVVLDPFCGCGTAVHAAEKLGRQWLGIDITHLAISLISKRMRDAFGAKLPFQTYGLPRDLASAHYLADQDKLNQKYEFEYWACSLVQAMPSQQGKRGADRGIDGLAWFDDASGTLHKVVVSVNSGAVGVAMIRDLCGVMAREKAEIGLFITLEEPTQPMRTEAAAAGFYHSAPYQADWPRVQILTIRGLLDGSEKPQYINLDPGVETPAARRESSVAAEDQQNIP